jgi:hypothetical protein
LKVGLMGGIDYSLQISGYIVLDCPLDANDRFRLGVFQLSTCHAERPKGAKHDMNENMPFRLDLLDKDARQNLGGEEGRFFGHNEPGVVEAGIGDSHQLCDRDWMECHGDVVLP